MSSIAINVELLTKTFLLLLVILRCLKAAKDLVDENRFGLSAYVDHYGMARLIIENKKSDVFNVDMIYLAKDYNKFWYFFRKLCSTNFSTKLKVINSKRNSELPAEMPPLSNKSIFFSLDDSSYKADDILKWKNRPLIIRVEMAGHVVLKEAKYIKTPIVAPSEADPQE